MGECGGVYLGVGGAQTRGRSEAKTAKTSVSGDKGGMGIAGDGRGDNRRRGDDGEGSGRDFCGHWLVHQFAGVIFDSCGYFSAGAVDNCFCSERASGQSNFGGYCGEQYLQPAVDWWGVDAVFRNQGVIAQRNDLVGVDGGSLWGSVACLFRPGCAALGGGDAAGLAGGVFGDTREIVE